jgi:hypothetical protein
VWASANKRRAYFPDLFSMFLYFVELIKKDEICHIKLSNKSKRKNGKEPFFV